MSSDYKTFGNEILYPADVNNLLMRQVTIRVSNNTDRDAIEDPREGMRVYNEAERSTQIYKNGLWLDDGFQEIGRTTLSSAASSITVTDLPLKKYLKLIMLGLPTGGNAGFNLQFNGDTANSYTRRSASNGGTDSTQISQSTSSAGDGSATRIVYGELDVINLALFEKLFSGHVLISSASSAAMIHSRLEWTGKWANTSVQASSVSILPSSNSFNIGSELIVLGKN